MPKRNRPIDDFIKEATEFESNDPAAQARYQEYVGRRGKELELWHKYRESGWKPEHATPLLKSLEPLINREVNKQIQGMGGSVSRAALKNELVTAAMKSFKTFDPSSPAKLPTWVTTNFQRTSDFRNAVRNAKYVPSEDMKRYDRYRNAYTELEEELGKPPTAQELQQKLPWKPKVIEKMMRSFGSEAYTDMGDNLSPNDEHAKLGPRDAFFAVHAQLKPLEREFGQMYYPPPGEAPPTIKNVAKALGVPQHKAYRLRQRIQSLMEPHIKKQ